MLVGTALAQSEGTFRPLRFVCALVGSIFIQIGTNLVNDYSDAKRGADTVDRLGPVRVTAAGLVAPRSVLVATWIAFAVAVAAGIYLATVADLWAATWVTLPFVLLLVIAGLGATVLRRGEERLVARSEAGDEAGYASALATVRTWTYATLALIVIAIFLMTVKPFG